MAKIWLHRSDFCFLPSDKFAQEVLMKMDNGDCAAFEIVRPRSVAMNRMYFGICRSIGDNQDPPRSEDSIDLEIRIRAGHFDTIVVDGREVRVPRRIAFHKLTHDEWMALWPSIEQAVAETWGPEYLDEHCAA